MKREFILIVWLLLPFVAAKAGDGNNQPMFQVGKVWNYDYSYVEISYEDGSSHRIYGICTYNVEKDTIVNGKRFYWVRTTMSDSEYEFRQLWHEEAGRVYKCGPTGKSFSMVYDFNLYTGEELPNPWDGVTYPIFTVSSSDTIFTHGTMRRRIVLSPSGGGNKVPWVEGIGGPGILDEPICHLVSDGSEYSLSSCYQDGECLFTKEDFEAEPYHADSEGIELPHSYAASSPGATYDLHGRKVETDTRPGVYIRNGKKLVVK